MQLQVWTIFASNLFISFLSLCNKLSQRSVSKTPSPSLVSSLPRSSRGLRKSPMNNLGWDNSHIPSIFRNSSEIAIPPPTATIWSNYQYDYLSESGTDCCIVTSKAELNESLLNSSFEQLQGDLINVDRINEVVEMLAPAFDSMSNNSLDLDLLLQQQDSVTLAADSVVSSHHHHHRLVSFPATATATAGPRIALDPLGSITEIFGAYQELHIFASAKNDYADGAVSVTFPRGGSDNICNNNSSGNFSSSVESEGSSQAESLKNRQNCKRELEDRHSSENLPLSTSSTSTERGGGGGFQIFFDKSPKSKKPRSEKESSLCSIDFRQESGKGYEPDAEAIAQVKEMIYMAAAMRPVSQVQLEEAVEKRKRKNVKISSDPQTAAARHRRERISERLRVLQKLVPGGSKMDTASMLDEAANYLKFLKSQVSASETLSTSSNFSPFPFNHHQQQQQAFPMQSTALFAHHPKP